MNPFLFHFYSENGKIHLTLHSICKGKPLLFTSPEVHFWAADCVVRRSVLCSHTTCIHSQQTDTGGLPGDLKVFSLWRLQIHCSQICIPQKVLQSFQDDRRCSYLCQETDKNSPKKFCPIILSVHPKGELTLTVFSSALYLFWKPYLNSDAMQICHWQF